MLSSSKHGEGFLNGLLMLLEPASLEIHDPLKSCSWETCAAGFVEKVGSPASSIGLLGHGRVPPLLRGEDRGEVTDRRASVYPVENPCAP
jgi:hypothetical protein